jgi:hypothetical protein
MKRYVVFHDYGPEGWKIEAECDTLTEAVKAREADLANGGGRSLIFEAIQVVRAYRDAFYESPSR